MSATAVGDDTAIAECAGCRHGAIGLPGRRCTLRPRQGCRRSHQTAVEHAAAARCRLVDVISTAFDHKIVKYGLGWKGFDYAEMERHLDELGRQGWEAVSTIQPSLGSAATDIVVLLKRPRS